MGIRHQTGFSEDIAGTYRKDGWDDIIEEDQEERRQEGEELFG